MHGIVILWAASARIWIVALPLVAHRFHLVTPVALLINPLLWLPMAVALFSGFGVLLLGGLCPPCAQLCGALCDTSLGVMESLIQLGLMIPYSHFWIPGPSAIAVLLIYAAGAVLLLKPNRVAEHSVFRAATIVWALASLLLVGLSSRHVASSHPSRVSLTFVSVGHGLCILARMPNGKTLLYDAGRQGPPDAAIRPIAAVLWSERITRLDAVVLSHADTDHYNAMPALLERFQVGTVYVSSQMFRQRAPALDALRTTLRKRQISVRLATAGDCLFAARKTRVGVVFPPADAPGSDNARSIVLCIRHGPHAALLTGDLESPGLERLLEEKPLECDVALAPHHGSLRSKPAEFAAWSKPEWVIISESEQRTTPAMREAWAVDGANVVDTASAGAVRVHLNSEGVEVRRWRSEPW
jgi:competence protein ComEC